MHIAKFWTLEPLGLRLPRGRRAGRVALFTYPHCQKMSNSHEERRKKEKPTTTKEQAALLASSLYNVTPSAPLKPLDSYDDRNFYVPPTGKNGTPFLLKVHNGVESDNTSVLEAQDAIMKYLAKEGFNCSEPIASVHGRTIEYTTTSQRRHAVRALKWVNGKILNCLPPTPGKKRKCTFSN